MDTRAKIISAQIAAAQAAHRSTTILLSSFDVLTAERIACAGNLARPGALLIAVITDFPNSLLPTRARAELAASLAIIDLVIVADEPVPDLLTRFPHAAITDDTAADTGRAADFLAYVHRRNRADAQ